MLQIIDICSESEVESEVSYLTTIAGVRVKIDPSSMSDSPPHTHDREKDEDEDEDEDEGNQDGMNEDEMKEDGMEEDGMEEDEIDDRDPDHPNQLDRRSPPVKKIAKQFSRAKIKPVELEGELRTSVESRIQGIELIDAEIHPTCVDVRGGGALRRTVTMASLGLDVTVSLRGQSK